MNSWFTGGAVTVEGTNITYNPDLEEGIDYGVLNITTATPVATGEMTSYNNNAEVSTVAGNTYDWAAKYALTRPGTKDIDYDVYVDQYGNLIGLVEHDYEDNYTILDSGMNVTTGYSSYYAAEILDMASGELKEVTVDSYNTNAHNSWATQKPATPIHKIVTYTESEDGYEMTDATVVDGNKVIKGEPRVYNNTAVVAVANASTVYAVENSDCEFVMYTGYANVPSISGADIDVLIGEDGYAELVYIMASNATFAGEEVFAFPLSTSVKVGEGQLADGTEYDIWNNVVIDGEVVNVWVIDGFSLVPGVGVTLKYNTDELVCATESVDWEFPAWTVKENNAGEVIYFNESSNGYLVDTDSVIWIIEGTDVTVGTADDLNSELGAACWVVVDDEALTPDKVIVIK